MILYPAIDLKDGNCVRLYKGDMDQDTVYNDSPADQALTFARAGFSWLHVVDLNGAIDGKPVNSEAVKSILSAIDLPVQLGGGIRTLENIEYWLGEGISRIILGTAALRDPDLVRHACALFPGQIAVGIDARGGMVAVEGWAQDSNMRAEDLAKMFEDAGVATIIYTDIDRDGTGQGVNFVSTIALAQSTSIPVIASGGVGSVADVENAKNASNFGIKGLIIGKAFYEGKISFEEALEASI